MDLIHLHPCLLEDDPLGLNLPVRMEFLLGDVSIWPNGIVRSGYVKVSSAMRSGRERILAEVVYNSSWFLKDAVSKVKTAEEFKVSGRGVLPDRTEDQRRKSEKLYELLKGKEEMYPVLVLENPS